MQQLLVVVFAAAFLGGCECTLFKDVVYDINSLLVCHVQNPLANIAGQPALIEGIPTIPLVPGDTRTVWLPQESGFAPPVVDGGPALDQSKLLSFLGKDYNGQYFVYQSSPNPDVIQGRSTPQPLVPVYLVDGQPMLLSPSELSGTSPKFVEYIDHLLNITGLSNTSNILASLTGFGIGNCPLAAKWAALPPTFFPNVFYGGYCFDPMKRQNTFCSIPTGMYCKPDLRPKYVRYEVILRWDCCTTYINKKWTYSCGWRKVRFPVVGKCFCGCDASTQAPLPFLG